MNYWLEYSLLTIMAATLVACCYVNPETARLFFYDAPVAIIQHFL